MKDTMTIANELVALCREGKFDQVYNELYDAEKIESLEPKGATFETVTGMEALMKKGEAWNASVEAVLSSEVSDPIVAENFFAITMKMKAKLKDVPEPIQMDEVCVYHVDNGKIVLEQFFYTPEADEVKV
ncbi:SnoaL-like domain-containing protein [Marinoscillum sp.]|uniref:SnoaL-like domain-containing protein n=1 Tax=Marinoscillum sp. TaxID=2024838 RepID=UPI003BAC193A